MSEKKDKKTENKDDRGKKDGVNKTVKSATDAILGQLITEYTRPMVDKIPISALQMMKSVGVEKMLPIAGIILSTIFSKEKFPVVGDKLGDFINEATAELRRVINEKVGDGEGAPSPDKKTSSSAEGVKNFNRILLNPELVDEATDLLTAFGKLFKNGKKDRPEKEKKQIMALLNQMSAKELYIFLSGTKTERKLYLDAFVKKSNEKSFKEALDEFKKDLKKFKEGLKVANKEMVKPIFTKLDKITGAKKDGTMGPQMKKIDDGVGQICNFLKSLGKVGDNQ